MLVNKCTYLGDFFGGLWDVLLAAEPGIDCHQKHRVNLVNDFVDATQRRGWINGNADMCTSSFDELDGAMQVGRGFDVDTDLICAGSGEAFDIALWLDNHQVTI